MTRDELESMGLSEVAVRVSLEAQEYSNITKAELVVENRELRERLKHCECGGED